MKRIVTNYSLLALAAALVAGLAIASAGDPPLGVKATGEKLMLVSEGAGAETFALGDLRDGESRTFQGKSGTVTVTRKGDALEVKIDGEGGERHVTVTSGEGDEGRIIVRKVEGGGEPRVIVMRHAGAKDGAVWTGEAGETVEIETVDGNAVFVGDGEPHHVFVTRHGHGAHEIAGTAGAGGEHAELIAIGGGDGFAWSTGGKAMLHYRCAEDDVIVGGPKDKLDTLTPTCPVCGKAMQKLEGAKHKAVTVKVTKEEGGDKPPQI